MIRLRQFGPRGAARMLLMQRRSRRRSRGPTEDGRMPHPLQWTRRSSPERLGARCWLHVAGPLSVAGSADGMPSALEVGEGALNGERSGSLAALVHLGASGSSERDVDSTARGGSRSRGGGRCRRGTLRVSANARAGCACRSAGDAAQLSGVIPGGKPARPGGYRLCSTPKGQVSPVAEVEPGLAGRTARQRRWRRS